MICCSEARITDKIIESEYDIDGYNVIICEAKSRRTGGVAMYIKKPIKFKLINRVIIDGYIWCLAIEITDCIYMGVYGTFYVSPSVNKLQMLDELNNWIGDVADLRKNVLLFGDLNIDLSKRDINTRKFYNDMNRYGLKQIVDFYTREEGESKTLIDVVLTNLYNDFLCLPIKEEKVTDHETILFKIKYENFKDRGVYTEILSWKKYDKYEMLNNLRNQNWAEWNELHLNEKLNLLTLNIERSVMDLTEKVRINLKPKKIKWFDNELRTLKLTKNNMYNSWRESRDEQSWNEYKKVRNQYNKLVKNKSNEQIKNEVKSAGTCTKKVWKCLNKLLGKNKGHTVNNIMKFDGQIIEDEGEISDRLNKFFITSVKELNDQIPETEIQKRKGAKDGHKTFRFQRISIDKVNEIAAEVKRKTNMGDLCNAATWFDSMEYIGFFFTSIINESLNLGMVPDKWKVSTIKPIPKIKNTQLPQEYRPINTLPTDEKIMEKYVKELLMRFVSENDILVEQQSGFRPMHSCETAVINLVDECRRNIDNGNKVIIVFLDLKRAFETVDRDKLLKKLYDYGIRGTEHDWFRSYLSNRKQKTYFGGELSDEIDIDIGLPQGSALGPLLFVLYINDIVNVKKFCDIFLFADDTALMIKAPTWEMAFRMINNDLKEIYNWLNENKLLLNVKKTKWMALDRVKMIDNEGEIRIGAEIIERVECIKYLGVHIDDQLTFSEHIDVTARNAAQKTNILFRLSKKLTFNTKKQIYMSIIAPIFEYCSTIIFSCDLEDIRRLQLIQNRAMRIILRRSRDSSRIQMLNDLRWLSIYQKLLFNVCIMIFKMKNGLVPKYLTDKLIYTRDVHEINTRNKNDLRLPRVKTEAAKKSIYFEGVKIFNKLPSILKEEKNLQKFKRDCENHIKNKINPFCSKVNRN